MKTIFAVAIVAIAAAAVFVVLHGYGVHPQDVARWLKSVGGLWWAPFAFIALYAIFNTFLLPATALTLTAGIVWGWFAGGLWVLVASTFASAIPYFIARSGATWVEELLRRRGGRVFKALKDEGFISLLLMRFVPLVPYNVLNYAAGLAGIPFRTYVAATFIGTIPGIFIFTYLASSIAAGVVSPRQAFLRILIAGALLAILALISRLLTGRVKALIGGEKEQGDVRSIGPEV